MTTALWAETLDAYERRLAQQVALLDAVDGDDRHAATPPPLWEPPAGLGVVPAELAPRARDLLTATHALLARSRATAERLRPHAERAPRPALAPVVPHRLDLNA